MSPRVVGRDLGVSENNVFVSSIENRAPQKADYNLRTQSPAVDAGRLEYWLRPMEQDPDGLGWPHTTDTRDLNEAARFVGPAPDAGCYELPYALPSVLRVR